MEQDKGHRTFRSQHAGDDSEASARREFLKKLGKAGATAPAVALLMAANSKPADAQAPYNGGGGSGSG